MYTMQLGDYKYVFEYDNIEDLKEQLAITKATHNEIIEAKTNYQKVNNVVNAQDSKNIDKLTFSKLELLFVKHLKEEEKETNKKLSEASYKAYATVFSKLKEYFEDEDINNLKKENFLSFRNYLVRDLKLNEKLLITI